jgi:hypothetical protein
VQLNKKLFLLDNDVWSSTDGLTWTKETSEILKSQSIFGYSAVVFDEQIWLLGCNRNGRFSSPGDSRAFVAKKFMAKN